MADNKLLLRRDADENFFAEDDPLAELARIVGFEPKVDAKPSAATQRREPEFDLEDELLKEFEQYSGNDDAYPVLQAAEPSYQAYQPAQQVEQPIDEVVHAPEPEPVAEIAQPEPVALHEVFTDREQAPPLVAERPASHPVFDLEDEISREFAAFDARRVQAPAVAPEPVAAEVVHQEPLGEEPAYQDEESFVAGHQPAELYDVPAVEPKFQPTAASTPVAHDLNSILVDELVSADEVQHSIERDSWAQSAQAEESFQPQAVDEDPGLDLAVEDASYWADIEQEAGTRADDAPATAFDDLPEIDLDEAFADLTIDEPVVTSQVAAPVAADAASHGEHAMRTASHIAQDGRGYGDNDFGLDSLLAEVEKYPVVENTARWSVQATPIAATEVFSAAPPVTNAFAPQVQGAREPAFEEVEAPVFAEPAFDEDVHFDESSFELDLGEIELDLAEFEDIEAVPAKAAAVYSPEPVAAAAAPVMQQAKSNAPAEDYSTLPFDPSQVTVEEEFLEALPEMDVPEIPVVHEEEKPAQHAEYDIDIDADMAQLFAAASGQPARRTDSDADFGKSAQAPLQPMASDLDEFERALEEDFRRSFAENRSAGAGNPDRVALTPTYMQPERPRSRRNWMLMAGTAAAIVLFGGAGVYAFMSGETKLLTSSEPKIILADKDPIKVEPDENERGGKQVPNQNKAVYDRVSGDNSNVTKQESLLSSNEEPVDVVQRTLMPENLPMDDESGAMATPTGDTVDPRLLPDDEQDRTSTTNKVANGVSPRKVKTMVVKSDGTLVAREDTAEDQQLQATNDAELLKIAQKAAQDASTSAESSGDDIAKAIGDVPERLSATDNAAAASDVPVKSVRTTPVIGNTAAKPIEAAAVADDVNAVDKTDLKPVTDTAAERSIAPVADDSAVADAANADVVDAPVRPVKTTKITPVPESRPAEQPVNVVGTVSDQGNVQKSAPAQQEVAAIDQTQQQPAAALTAGSYVIQIASLPSEADAQNSYAKLSSKFAGVIGGRGVDIKRAEIKNKGTYYRVRIPAGNKQEAQALCEQYKSAGGSCLVSK